MAYRKLLTFILLSSSLALATGCASIERGDDIRETGISKPITGPDGSAHELVECEKVETCYKKAADVCNGKYRIIDDSTAYNGSYSKVSLLVKCGS